MNAFPRVSWALAALLLLPLALPSQGQGGGGTPRRDAAQAQGARSNPEPGKKADDRRDGTNQAGPTVEGTLSPEWVKTFKWRSIGPAGMGGRITGFAVYEADPTTYWVATASGGLLKTVNNGTTFEHQFDREATVSIGDVCVAPSDRNIVWVGTGEANPRNSVSYGDGVYKSTDGGKTWKNMGLKETFQVGRIAIHPKNPDVVYVGALGRLYGPNAERGVFKTADGGKTWEKVLSVNDATGVIDLAMSPRDPETLLAAMWERRRDGFDSFRGDPPLEDGYDAYDPVKKWGPGGGIYKTTDGGRRWKKVFKGLPTCPTGRIGLSYYRKDPSTVFAIIDCQKIGMGTPPSRLWLGVQGADATAEGGAPGARLTQITPQSPAAKAELKAGDVVKGADGQPIKGYSALTGLVRGRKAGDKMVFQVLREGKTLDMTLTLEERTLGSYAPGRLSLFGLLGAGGDDIDGGIRLTRIVDERAAEKAGLREGDVLKELDGKPVTGSDQVVELLRVRKDGDVVPAKVLRDGEPKEVKLTLEAPAGGGGPGTSSRSRPWGYMYGGQQANIHDDQGPDSHEYGGIYRSTDGGESWTRINSLNPRPMYFSQIRVDPSDEKYLYVLGVNLHRSADGGKTFKDDGGERVHSDQHALWIDPRDGRHMLVGCDGGFYATYDRMDHWDHLNHMAIGQFYHVAVDNRQPYRVYGGLQDNGSWGGPTLSLSGAGPINEDWISVGGGDGFVCRVDPFDPDIVYSESQDGSMGRRNLRTGERATIRPRPPQGTPPSARYRFNWNTPFILSSHNPGIFYCAGNRVFRSLKRGDDLKVISPEIGRTGRGTATALAESPRNADVLWAGTDDGNLWVSRDGGAAWANVAEKVGLPGPRWVATIEPSRFVEGRCYVAFDAHRSDDDEPYLFATEDFGETWKPLRANLPAGSTHCLREDVKNANLLFAGTEFAAWVSLNRGASWTKLNNNLPTVPVFEFAIHPTAGEMVAATHGRSLWVLDVNPLRQMTTAILQEKAHLYEPNPVIRWRSEPSRGLTGDRYFVGENPPRGAPITVSFTQKPEKVSLKIVDYAGRVVRELPLKAEAGLQQVTWDLGRGGAGPGGFGRGGGGGRGAGTGAGAGADPMPTGEPPGEGTASGQRGGGGPGGGGGGGGRGGFGPPPVPPGTYRVILTVDGQELTQPLRIEPDPVVPAVTAAPGTGPAEDDAERERDRPRRPIDD